MDIFYHIGTLCHVIALIILIYKLIKTKSSVGFSGKSQILFALVYSTRYLDLFYSFISYYNSVMKVTYIITSYIIIFLIYVMYMDNNEKKNDTFMSEFLITPAFIIALFVNHSFQLEEILWTFSIYLEAVAIIPQLYLIHKKKEIDRFVLGYLGAMGLYRALYIPHWIYRYNWEGHFDMIADVAGLIHIFIFLMVIFELIFTNTVHITDGNNEKRYLIRNIFFISDSEMSEGKSHHPLLQENDDPMRKVYVIPRQEKEDPRKMIHEPPKQKEEDPSYNKSVHVV